MYLKKLGLDQWQGEYSSCKTAEEDVSSHSAYVLADASGRVTGVVTLFMGDDPLYRGIEGPWAFPEPYVSIHRMALAPFARGQGLSKLLFSHCIARAKELGACSVRVDTHPENKIMQTAIRRGGFIQRGQLYLPVGVHTECYELLL
jgi:GNAT superfamily N-acetyltransferase